MTSGNNENWNNSQFQQCYPNQGGFQHTSRQQSYSGAPYAQPDGTPDQPYGNLHQGANYYQGYDGYQQPTKSKAWLWIIIAVVAVTVLGVVLWLVLGRGDGKPSRDEVRDGYEQILIERYADDTYGLETPVYPEGFDIDAYYECVVDGIYDNMTTESLEIIASGDSELPLPHDQLSILVDYDTGCYQGTW